MLLSQAYKAFACHKTLLPRALIMCNALVVLIPSNTVWKLISIMHARYVAYSCVSPSSNAFRTTSAEKREQEKLQQPILDDLRQAAEVHRQVGLAGGR